MAVAALPLMDEQQDATTNSDLWTPPTYTPPPGVNQPDYVFNPPSTSPMAPTTTPMPDVTVPPVPGTTPGAPGGFGNTVKNIATNKQPMGSDWNFGAQPTLGTNGTRDLTNDPSMQDRMNQAAADKAAAARKGLTYGSPWSGMF